jgi:ubiquinone/menaquinone biosynthesis C-methylase UbiE/DNA-binding transcriptional ArsR family regulator
MKHSAPLNLLSSRLAVLAEPIRVRILRVLERTELSVGEVAQVVQLPQSTASRHLKTLADDGWLAKRSEGTAALYRMILDDLPADARTLWVTVRDTLATSPELEEDNRRLTSVLAERRNDSQGFFGRVAGAWDDVRSGLFGDRFTLQALAALLPAAGVVADIGCGTGNVAELVAPFVKRVIAADFSPAMLAAARKRLAGVENVEFVVGELPELAIPDATADVVFCVLVMHHLADPQRSIGELARITRPGGRVVIVDMLEHDRESYRHTMGHRWLGFAPASVDRMLTAAGLEAARVTALPSDPQAKGPGLFVATAERGRGI